MNTNISEKLFNVENVESQTLTDQTPQAANGGTTVINIEVNIEVNGHLVTLTKIEVTGSEIKQAAIDQGVQIQLNFVLQLEQANGAGRIVGDCDHIKLHNQQCFTVIAPDDNS